MALRTALDQSKVVTFAALVAIAWTLMNVVSVLQTMEGMWGDTGVAVGEYVGPAAASGVVGALVMAGLVGLLVYLVAELGETEPTPSPWPPESE